MYAANGFDASQSSSHQGANQQQRQGPPPSMPPPPPMGGQPPAPGNVKSLRHRPSQAHIYGQTSPQQQAFSPPAVSTYSQQSPQHSFSLPPPENSFGQLSPVPSSAQMSFGQPSPQQQHGFPPGPPNYGQQPARQTSNLQLPQSSYGQQSPQPPAPPSFGQQSPMQQHNVPPQNDHVQQSPQQAASYGGQLGQNGYDRRASQQAPTFSPPAAQDYSHYQQDGIDGFGGSQVSFAMNDGSAPSQMYGNGSQSNPPYGDPYNPYRNESPAAQDGSYGDGAQYQSYGTEATDAGLNGEGGAHNMPPAPTSYEQQSASQPADQSSSAPHEFSQYQQNEYGGYGGNDLYQRNEESGSAQVYGDEGQYNSTYGGGHYQSYGAEAGQVHNDSQTYADGSRYHAADPVSNSDMHAAGSEHNAQYPPHQSTEIDGFIDSQMSYAPNGDPAAHQFDDAGQSGIQYDDQYQFYGAQSASIHDTPYIHADNEDYDLLATDATDAGMENDGGESRVETITTTVCATCRWTLRNFLSDPDEKMVSLPFGPANWQYQLVFFPKGTGDDIYASIFVRPLKSEKELLAGDHWSRPVTSNSPDEEYIVSTKSEPTLVGFDSTTTGWGFPEMLERSLLPEAVASDGALYIDARLLGDIAVEWTVYRWRWELPRLDELTESVTYSRPFGPVDHKWRLRLHPHGTKKGQSTHVSAYLEVVKSKNEIALGRAWSRPIVCLSMKVYAGSESDPLSTPALTGGWVFRDDNKDDIGWDTLVAIDKLNESGDGRFLIVTEVTWDPSHDAAETDLGKVKHALADTAKDIDATKELRSELESIQEEKQQCEEQLQRTQARLKTLGDIEARMALMQKDIVAAHKRAEEADIIEDRFSLVRGELATAREDQQHADTVKTKIAEAKARLAALRAGMDDGVDMSIQSSSGPGDAETPEVLKAELLRANAKALELEKELVALRADSDAKSRALTDAALNAPLGDSSEALQSIADPDMSIMERVQLVRNEILVVRGTLLDVEDRPVDSPAARASLSAELAMAQADLEVTRATFVGMATQYASEIEADPDLAIEVDIVFGELRDARAQMVAKRLSLEEPDDIPEVAAVVTHQDRATSPIRQPIRPLPHVPQFTPTDFGVASVATRDGSHAVPLPAGVPPPPTALDVYSQPVPSSNHQQAAHHHLVLRAQEEAAAAQHELANLRYERDAVVAELEETRQRMLDAREALVNSRANGGSQAGIDPHSVMETLFGRRMSLGSNAPMPPDVHEEAETWTPVGKKAAGVSGKEVSARLSQLGHSQRSGIFPSLLPFTVTLLTIWFALYSTVYVACSSNHLANNPKAVYREACETRVLPAWSQALNYWHGATNQLVGHWHGAAERFVVDIAPGMEKGFKAGIKKGRKAVKQIKQRVAARAAEQAVRESDAATQVVQQPTLEDAKEGPSLVTSEPPARADELRREENGHVVEDTRNQPETVASPDNNDNDENKSAEANAPENGPGRDGSGAWRKRLNYREVANSKPKPQEPHAKVGEDQPETVSSERTEDNEKRSEHEVSTPPQRQPTTDPPAENQDDAPVHSRKRPAPAARHPAGVQPPPEVNIASENVGFGGTPPARDGGIARDNADSLHEAAAEDSAISAREPGRATDAMQPPPLKNESIVEPSVPSTGSSIAADVPLSDPPPATAASDHHGATTSPTHPHDLSPTAPAGGPGPDTSGKPAGGELAGPADPVEAFTDLTDAPPHVARAEETTAASDVDAPAAEAAVSAPQPAETASSAGWRETLVRSAATVNQAKAALEHADIENSNAEGHERADASAPIAIPDLPLPRQGNFDFGDQEELGLAEPIAEAANTPDHSDRFPEGHDTEEGARVGSSHDAHADSVEAWHDDDENGEQSDKTEEVGASQNRVQPASGGHDEF
ncbi:hypothetical protein HDU86_000035 [Geranomyces michiganensis]|nr:hypothetical protein HDU86_000035 [Geranomyces michiganensis]